MAVTNDPGSVAGPSSRAGTFGPLALAGMASLGAGAIHCTAVGMHSEHRPAALAFALLAAFQVGWGAVALFRRDHWLAFLGAAGNAVAFAGWVVAKTSGIGFIDGLETKEGVQWADGVAAGLALVAIVAAIVAIQPAVEHRLSARHGGAARAGMLSGLAVGLVAVSVAGMVAAGSHSHAGGGHGHGDAAEAGAGHDHGSSTGDQAVAGKTQHDHAASAVVAPKPYDPTKPIDLGGVEGVSAEQQARAENSIALTLARLPQWADPKHAEANGYHSIGDGITGYEHYVNWDTINDDHILDPDHPEALVYATRGGGGKKLVSAMYMLKNGETLDTVPDLGGKLTQWHIHDNLCFSDDPEAPTVAGITTSGGQCRAPLRRFEPVPMIHIWIVPHPCGPFAALEGVGAGQIKSGETRLCDHDHGAGTGT